MDIKHTPTPWQASKRGDAIIVSRPTANHGCGNAREVEHYGGYVVAESLGDADREFVLHACNAHEQLVKTLRDIANNARLALDEDAEAWMMELGDIERNALAALKAAGVV